MRQCICLRVLPWVLIAICSVTGCRRPAGEEKPKPPELTPATVLKGDDGQRRTLLAASSDGKLLAFRNRADGSLRLWDLEAGKERDALKGFEKTSLLAFIPGSRIVASSSYEIASVDRTNADTGVKDKSIPLPQKAVAIALSRDGKLLASGHDEAATVLSLETGQVLKALTLKGSFGVGGLVFSPDSKMFFATGPSAGDPYIGAVRRWDVETWNELDSLRGIGGPEPAQFITADPKGKLVVFVTGIQVIAYDLAAKKNAFWDHRGTAMPAFSPDGRWLLWADIDHMSDLGRRIEADAKGQKKNVDGEWIDTVRLRLYDVNANKHHIILNKQYPRIWKVVFCNDNTFATMHDDNSVQVWSLAGLKLE